MAHAFGYPEGYEDPTFGKVLDRFEKCAAEAGFPYTVFVIGRDLEKPAHVERLRDLRRKGHEIANHTWNHHTDLGALPATEMREEIARTHYALAEQVGAECRGFVAPAWSHSARLSRTLGELGYRYDTSVFSSPLYYPFVLKNAWNHRTNRRDWLQPLKGRREPYLDGPLVSLPMPTTPGPLGMAVWHTTGFLLGWDTHFDMLRAAVRARRYFYYVVHPADLTCDDDFADSMRHHLERAGGNLEEKMRRMRESLRVISGEMRDWVTLGQMAEAARAELAAAQRAAG
jgi:peptidoglycan-N-acetylglucosamine deacetylase